MRILLALASVAAVLGQTIGAWKLDAAKSSFAGDTRPKSLTIRIEQHPKGEVFTLDRVETDGRGTSSSTVLYLDGVARDFRDFGCSGTQSTRRVDRETIEILRTCASGAWSRLVRRAFAQTGELVLEISEQKADGHRLEQRLVLERQ